MSKRFLLLGGGYEQLNALRIAKELGAYVIVFDGQKRAPCMFEADEYYQVNIKNEDELLAAAAKVNAQAVFVHAAELAVEGSLVTTALDVPGISTLVAQAGTDKAVRSDRLMQSGIKIPAFQSLDRSASWEAWQSAAQNLKLPLIAKPTRLAGAKGVELIENFSTLKAYYNNRGDFSGQDFVLEEYVKGLQLSTESVIMEGNVRCLSVALRHYDTTQDLLPYQIEDGHSMPWGDTEKYKEAISEVTSVAAKAIGMQNGVLKGDLVLLEDGRFVVLEMAVRTSGGRFCDTVVPLSSGLNILYPLIKMSLGHAVAEIDFNGMQTNGVSQRFLLVSEGVPLKKEKRIQQVLLQKGVAGSWFREDIHTLDKAPVIKSHRDRLGYVICTGTDRLDADRNAQAVIRELHEAIVEAEAI